MGSLVSNVLRRPPFAFGFSAFAAAAVDKYREDNAGAKDRNEVDDDERVDWKVLRPAAAMYGSVILK